MLIYMCILIFHVKSITYYEIKFKIRDSINEWFSKNAFIRIIFFKLNSVQKGFELLTISVSSDWWPMCLILSWNYHFRRIHGYLSRNGIVFIYTQLFPFRIKIAIIKLYWHQDNILLILFLNLIYSQYGINNY